MPDYKEMYETLLAATVQAIGTLAEAQQKCALLSLALPDTPQASLPESHPTKEAKRKAARSACSVPFVLFEKRYLRRIATFNRLKGCRPTPIVVFGDNAILRL